MAIQGVVRAEKDRVDDRSLCRKKIALMTALHARRDQRYLLRSDAVLYADGGCGGGKRLLAAPEYT